jgi:uncharacterized repeat protein (TIGR01451 family)
MKHALTTSDNQQNLAWENKMKTSYHFNTRRLAVSVLGALALAAALVCTGNTANAASSGTSASAIITNMAKVEYLDANGKGLNGTATPMTKSASTQVTVTLLAAAPSIGSPTPTPVQSVTSGATESYVFKVWSNANGIDGYTFDVSALANTNITSSDRYISATTNAQTVTTPTGGSGTTSVAFSIGAVTIISNTASTVNIPFGTKLPNAIADGDLIVINNVEYKVTGVATAGSAAVYNAGTSTLIPEVPTTLNITAVGGGAANLPTAGVGLAGLTLSEEYAVTVAVTATGDPTQNKGTACFTDTFKSTLFPAQTTTNTSSCTDFMSSNLTIAKTSNVATAKPNDDVIYTITVSLPAGAASSTKVKVTDAVPVYTTLKSNTYGASTFARVQKSADGGSTFASWVSLTNVATDTENAIASGDAAGTSANSALTFYLGAGNVGFGAPAGGTINANEVFKIEYTVTIN